jgi:superfamily II DNA or RNA helicase
MYLDHGQRRKFIAFSVNIQHAIDIAKTFQANGMNVQAIWGDDPDRDEKQRKT